ncbi:MAG TPA: cobalt-precorrin-7 (C(5))-methyltransferase, partial [Tissierellaceae bacterium]|nr:cobalt-precorrin-7 (C(5))-methyltransferase [Tissierellaceae bacterium]
MAGVGPGNPKYISLEVIEKIREFKYVVAFPRIATSLKDIREDIIVAKRVEDVLSLIDKQEEILLLASGDPNFYGIVEFLKRKKIKIREILPGLTSFQYMMAKLGKAWQGAHFLS